MNQTRVFSLPDLLTRANLIADNQSFSFQSYHTVWNQHIHGPEGSHVTHNSNYERDMSHKIFLDSIKARLKSRIPIITKMLDRNTSICSDICQLIAEYYVQNIDLDDLIIQYTKLNFDYPLKDMCIGIEHNAGGMAFMFEINQNKFPEKTVDLSNLPNLVFWLKNPKDLKGLQASLEFTDPHSTTENKYVYQTVTCDVQYKLYHIPNGRLLKTLRHTLSGYSARNNGSILIKEDDRYERTIYYHEKWSCYNGLPIEEYIDDQLGATPKYKRQINNLLPNYYL
jgi:hypothetical protein